LKIAEKAGFKTNGSEKSIDNSFWNLLEGMTDSIRGAYYCLMRDELSPVDNVPKSMKRGWDFALWYSFAAVARTNDYNEGFKIPRVTTMQSADKGAWTANKVFTDLDRLNTFIRSASAKIANKDHGIKDFIKGEGYFLGKLVGKKPVPGLYTASELEILQQDWETRNTATKAKLKALTAMKFSELPLGGTLNNALAKLQTAHTPDPKRIEEAKTRRIPELLISEGRGKLTKKVIAKGGDLPEKLTAIKGGDSVRTIAKVLYSPVCNRTIEINDWIHAIMAETRSRNLREGTTFFDKIENKINLKDELTLTEIAITQNVGDMQVAIQTYMEVLPDRFGSPAWDTTFGVFKLK